MEFFCIGCCILCVATCVFLTYRYIKKIHELRKENCDLTKRLAAAADLHKEDVADLLGDSIGNTTEAYKSAEALTQENKLLQEQLTSVLITTKAVTELLAQTNCRVKVVTEAKQELDKIDLYALYKIN